MTLLLILTYIVGLPVLVGSINALNQMDKCTPHGIRLAYMAMALGAMAAVLGPLFGKPENWTSFLMLAACALLFAFDERKYICGVPYVAVPRKH